MANIAVINLGGAQHIVRAGDKLEVNRLDQEIDNVFSPEVLMSQDKDDLLFNNGKVEAKVLEHTRGDKLYVIRFKAKSRYRRRTGHRQDLTLLQIVSVNGEKQEKKTVAKDEKSEVAIVEATEAKPKKAKVTKKVKEVAE